MQLAQPSENTLCFLFIDHDEFPDRFLIGVNIRGAQFKPPGVKFESTLFQAGVNNGIRSEMLKLLKNIQLGQKVLAAQARWGILRFRG